MEMSRVAKIRLAAAGTLKNAAATENALPVQSVTAPRYPRREENCGGASVKKEKERKRRKNQPLRGRFLFTRRLPSVEDNNLLGV